MLSATMLNPGYALPIYQPGPLYLHGRGFGDEAPAKKSIAPGVISLVASAALLGGLFFAIRKV